MAVTVTVFAVLQSDGVNERLYGYVRAEFRSSSMSGGVRPAPGGVRPTHVVPNPGAGSESRTTVNVAPVVSCSVTVMVVGLKVTPAVSSSVSVSVAFDGSATLLPPAAVPETVTDLSATSTSLSFAVTVTAPALVVEPAAMVSVFAVLRSKSAATAPVPAAAPTVTVTASLDTPDSVAVTVETPPSSEIDDGDRTSVSVGNASSSVIVSVASDGAATPLPPAAVAETVTDLSGASVALSTAVTVTAPVLVVAPAAMVSVVAVLSVKSVPDPGEADTVSVTASLDAPDSVAVTVLDPGFVPSCSSIVAGDRTSVTSGNASSSVMVSVTSDGADTPLPPAAVAETVTDLSGASVVSFIAVIVTVPALVVSPAAMVNVFALDSVKSVPDPGDADTVSVTASLDARSSVAVTVLDPGFVPSCSSIVAGDNASVTSGRSSSSVMVSVTLDGAATPLPPAAVAETVTDLSGASVVSFTAVIVTVPALAVCPAAMVSVFAVLSVKSVPDPGDADTVSVTAALDARFSVAVTVDTFDAPLSSIDDDDNASVTSGRSSSSVMVSVTADGTATPLPPAAVAETVTVLSGASTSLSFAVTVTAPVLVVSPAAMVNVFALDSVKSVPDPGDADTVSVTASLDARSSVAVTVLDPGFVPSCSSIVAGDNASVTSGRSSSSVMVSVTLAGAVAPLPPATVAETVTVLSGASVALSTAVTVTAPVLVVSPDAIVRVVPDNAKSPAAAGATAAADTVTVVASVAARSSVAVTVDTFDAPLSSIDDGDSASDTIGLSSSMTVTVTATSFVTPPA